MTKNQNSKQYDLEERTERFAGDCRKFMRQLPRTISNIEDAKQLVRSSGSIAANYIEANEALSKKDFLNRIKICRKEAKETCLWLRLIHANGKNVLEDQKRALLQESTELMKIFGSIFRKSE